MCKYILAFKWRGEDFESTPGQQMMARIDDNQFDIISSPEPKAHR